MGKLTAQSSERDSHVKCVRIAAKFKSMAIFWTTSKETNSKIESRGEKKGGKNDVCVCDKGEEREFDRKRKCGYSSVIRTG